MSWLIIIVCLTQIACLRLPHGVLTGRMILAQNDELSLAATMYGAKVYAPILDNA